MLVTGLTVVHDQSLRSCEFSHLHPHAIAGGRGRCFYDVWYLHYHVNPGFVSGPLASAWCASVVQHSVQSAVAQQEDRWEHAQDEGLDQGEDHGDARRALQLGKWAPVRLLVCVHADPRR